VLVAFAPLGHPYQSLIDIYTAGQRNRYDLAVMDAAVDGIMDIVRIAGAHALPSALTVPFFPAI
jgi:hypothetical protein